MECVKCSAPVLENDQFCGQCGAAVNADDQLNTPLDTPPEGLHLSNESTAGRIERLLREDVQGQFEVHDLIGRGGMALVYRATDTRLDRPVAIKVLPPELTFGSGIERFHREAQVSANLLHSNIVQIYTISSSSSLFWYAMQYMEGEGLDQRMQRAGPLSLDYTIEILTQVAAALDFAHDRGVIHRDVKPSNIMIDARGHVTMMDFGIAKALADPGALTQTGAVVGTPHYMSPEQAMGEALTGASDQYAAGMVAYTMLSGKLPFGGAAMNVLRGQVEEEPPPLEAERPDLPRYAVEAVHRSLAKDPRDRFRTVSDFVVAMSGSAATGAAVRVTAARSAPQGTSARSTWWQSVVSFFAPKPPQRGRRTPPAKPPAPRPVGESSPTERVFRVDTVQDTAALTAQNRRGSSRRVFDMETGLFYNATTMRISRPRLVTQDEVFLCYSRSADEEFALNLAKNLKALGIPVWVDQWDIHPGKNWDWEIDRALQRCTHLLIVISPESLASVEVQDEFLTALDEKKIVVPVLHREVRLHRRLRRIQHVDFMGREPNDRAGLIKIVRALDLMELLHDRL